MFIRSNISQCFENKDLISQPEYCLSAGEPCGIHFSPMTGVGKSYVF